MLLSHIDISVFLSDSLSYTLFLCLSLLLSLPSSFTKDEYPRVRIKKEEEEENCFLLLVTNTRNISG